MSFSQGSLSPKIIKQDSIEYRCFTEHQTRYLAKYISDNNFCDTLYDECQSKVKDIEGKMAEKEKANKALKRDKVDMQGQLDEKDLQNSSLNNIVDMQEGEIKRHKRGKRVLKIVLGAISSAFIYSIAK